MDQNSKNLIVFKRKVLKILFSYGISLFNFYLNLRDLDRMTGLGVTKSICLNPGLFNSSKEF